MGHDWPMSENPTSTSRPDEPDDATRVFVPGSAAPSPGAPSSQSSAPTWRSTTSASSGASASNPVPGWRSAPAQTPASASSASATPSQVSGSPTGSSWGHQQPAGRPSQPQPAPSWGGAPGRPSAQQPAAPQPAQSWSGQDWGQQGHYTAQQAPYAAPVAPAPAHKDGLRALFDLSFTEMVTPLVVKILYVLSMVVGILWWLFAILAGAGAASVNPYSDGGSSVMLVLGILLGWIPGVIIVLGTRMISEFVLSSLKTQRAAEDILTRLESQ